MARKTPIPSNEIAIGKRLREVRERLLINKTRFALEIGISRERLFNYEEGRTPLPWCIAGYIANVFDVNPLWLATGKGDPFLRVGFPAMSSRFGSRALLSAVIKKLEPEWKEFALSSQVKSDRHRFDDYAISNRHAELSQFARELLDSWLAKAGPRTREFLEELRTIGDHIIQRYTDK